LPRPLGVAISPADHGMVRRPTVKFETKKARRREHSRNSRQEGAVQNMSPGILSGVTVVVVENHDDARFVLVDFLTRQGARVIGCAKASDALAAVIRERPELVL
jgi:PleD family two-component response regulator